MGTLKQEVEATAAWMNGPRFEGITRLHTAKQIVEQRGTIQTDYPVARATAEAFHQRLRQLFEQRKSITTFGPYSPGQAVVMKRHGIEGIYLGGWATSAKGSINEDPGADLASYPLNQVPDEASAIVRALLMADRNQRFARAHMTPEQLASTPEVDYRPFIVADADTGHGGDAHVRNLIRRFVEAGVPGYHIEDQKPGVKKCGHQGGKVLVAENEQVMRLNAARVQLDIMGVPGIIVARTDAEAATLLESNTDERDQPFILGATKTDIPGYKAIVIAIHGKFFDLGVQEIRGHLMFPISEAQRAAADDWLTRSGVMKLVHEKVAEYERKGGDLNVEKMLDEVIAAFVERWQEDAGLSTYRQAVASAIAARVADGQTVGMTVEAWLEFAKDASLAAARARARYTGIDVPWDAELARTPEGYYQVQSGIDWAVAKSLAAAPFADILWMETATANLHEAREFAEAIHAKFPHKMLAYNLSPSFNWDTTGMTDQEMRQFPVELGKMGFVFNFITYGGHQIDGLAAEEFSDALRKNGMLALARLQRKLRLLESPYRTPQTLVGGPRMDAALMASSGRMATTKAMGKGSTQHQHLKQTEPAPQVLERWLRDAGAGAPRYAALLRPLPGALDALELSLLGDGKAKAANIVFVPMHDRRGETVLSVREQNVFDGVASSSSAMTLSYLYLVHRYQAETVQFINPTPAELAQVRELEGLKVFKGVTNGSDRFLVADVDLARVTELTRKENVGAAVVPQAHALGTR